MLVADVDDNDGRRTHYWVTFERAMLMAVRAMPRASQKAKMELKQFREDLARGGVAMRNRMIENVKQEVAKRRATEEKFAALRAEFENREKTLHFAERLVAVHEKEIDITQQAIATVRGLGDMDDRDRVFWGDRMRDATLCTSPTVIMSHVAAPAAPVRAIADAAGATADAAAAAAVPRPVTGEWPLSLYLERHGYARPTRDQLMELGKCAAALYRDYRGHEPPKRAQYVDGAVRVVNHYTDDDIDIVERAVKQMTVEDGERRPRRKKRRSC